MEEGKKIRGQEGLSVRIPLSEEDLVKFKIKVLKYGKIKNKDYIHKLILDDLAKDEEAKRE